MKTKHRFFIGFSSVALLVSCAGLAPKVYDEDNYKINDPVLALTREDYRNLPFVEPKNAEGYEGFETNVVGGTAEPPIPDIAPILSAPRPPKIGETKLVSIAVTDDVPLKDVLLELARLADIDVEVDAGITGGISFRATQRPFNEVIERIADFANLRYTMNDNVLRIERDDPFIEIYTLDFLNFERSASSSVNVSTSVLSSSGGEGGGGGGLTTGSSTSITTSSESDFWVQFEAGINRILTYTPELRTSTSTPAQVQTINTPAGPDGSLEDALSAPSPTPPTASDTSNNASTSASSGTGEGSENYTLNRQAGTLTIVATKRQHQLIEEFIRTLEYNASAQVVIEAKIVEVTLNEDFESGIDWSRFMSDGNSITASALFGGVTTGASNSFDLQIMKDNFTGLDIDLTAAVELAQIFGTTRTLSSPRLHAINNQQAVMTFAQNEVYFTVEVEREDEDTTTTSQTTITVNSTINTVPIGIIMTILPSINRRTGEVTLNVRPTLSRVVDRVEDPALALSLALDPALSALNIQNLIPVVEARELDSILKVKSGEVMVIGGLMEDNGLQSEAGIPGASEIPVLGHLFKGTDRSRETKELIIFIRATILDSNGYYDPADKRLYEKFSQDPRPLTF